MGPLSTPMRCAACGSENPPESRFCLECGSGFGIRCASCDAELPATAKFCNRCGAGTEQASARTEPEPAPPERDPRTYTPRHLAEKILRSKSALEGERKQVTVLFADVKGSMELAEGLDPEVWHGILDRFFQILTEGVHRFEGTVNQYTGDGIMALFGAPIAHEDHAHRACFAALHVRDAVRDYANEVRVAHGVSFGVRVGLNSGEVVVGKIGDDLRMDYTAQGQVVGLAQRMEQLAESGRICLSGDTARLVEGYFQLQDLGRTSVKGVREPVGLFDLEDVGAFRTRLDVSRARGLSSFVGRGDEMAALDAALERALAGEGRIVGVVAQAGVGKSRLCFEFVERCRAKGIAVHQAHCPAHGKTIPLLPVLELLRGYFGIREGDTPRAAREKVAGRLLLLDRDFEADLPIVWELLRIDDPERPAGDLEPNVREQRLLAFVRHLVRARSEAEPAVLLMDDLHWIDPQSDRFVAEQVEALRGTRTLLLYNFRPEYRADWMQRSDYQQLPLAPLGADAIRELLRDLLGPDPSVEGLPERIEARTAGNPFFTEEAVQGLIESGQLEGERGAYRLTGPVERIEIPESVQAVLSARIDRLPEREKRVLQMAAVIGKNFAGPLLAQVAELPERDLDEALRALCDAEFLYERSLYPIAEYAFKHPLTHEVANGSQLVDRRRAVHAAVARALERDGESAPLLAYHWDQADEPEPAVRWHREAAERGGGFAEREATIERWERICALLPRLPETRENLSLAAGARAQSLWYRARGGTDPETADRLFAEACALADRAGDADASVRARVAYGFYRQYSGQRGGGAHVSDALDRLTDGADPRTRVFAHWAGANMSFFEGSLRDCLPHVEAVLAIVGDDQELGADLVGYSPRLFMLAQRGAVKAAIGNAREGARDFEEALREHRPAHLHTRRLVQGISPFVYRVTGDVRRGLDVVRSGIAGYEESGTRLGFMAFAYVNLAHAAVLCGNWHEAHAALERTEVHMLESGSLLNLRSDAEIWRAEACCGLGDEKGARAALERAFAALEELPRLYPRTLAELARARVLRAFGGNAAEIDAALDRAAALIDEARLPGWRPEVEVERALLRERDGDAEGARRAREEALQRYRAIGADRHVERLERELAS